LNRPIGDGFSLYRDPPGTSNVNEIDGPEMPLLFFSYSFGVRWNLYHAIKTNKWAD
jgi:hypothetical protein